LGFCGSVEEESVPGSWLKKKTIFKEEKSEIISGVTIDYHRDEWKLKKRAQID